MEHAGISMNMQYSRLAPDRGPARARRIAKGAQDCLSRKSAFGYNPGEKLDCAFRRRVFHLPAEAGAFYIEHMPGFG